MTKLITLFVLIALVCSIHAYGLGCAPANNNQDCENPQTQTCTKILIGTTAKVKALGKYYYQCLPNEWASQAVASAQSKVLDVNAMESHVSEKVQDKVAVDTPVQSVKVTSAPIEEAPVATSPVEEAPEEEEEENVQEDEETVEEEDE